MSSRNRFSHIPKQKTENKVEGITRSPEWEAREQRHKWKKAIFSLSFWVWLYRRWRRKRAIENTSL